MQLNRYFGPGWLLVLLICLTAANPALALYEPDRLQDPSRRWAVSLALREGYDDNIFTTKTNTQSSATTTIEPQLLLNIPMEQTFLGLRYRYGAVYYADRSGNQVDQYHTVDLLFSHTFTPRLVLDVQDEFRFGVEPELVSVQNNVESVTRRRGDFLFNNLTGKLGYNLTRRWTMSVGGGWEYWRFDDSNEATTNDRDSYDATVSAVYAIDPRTTIGGNYRYEQVDYTAATNDVRNSHSHIAFVSVARRFNPKLTLQVFGGAELREFSGGTQETSPVANIEMTYDYGPANAATAGFRYELSTTEVGSFRNIQAEVFYVRAVHRITPKLRVEGNVSYVYSTFQNPTTILTPAPDTEYRLYFELDVTYDFTRWCHVDLSYILDKVDSNLPVEIADQSFDRNRVSLGLRMTY